MAPVGAWELALLNLLLSVAVQEVSPECPWPLQDPSSLGVLGQGRSGRSQAGCRDPVLRHRLPGLPWDMGDMVLSSSRSAGEKGLGMNCFSWLHRVMGSWVIGPQRDQCHCCGHPERGDSSIDRLQALHRLGRHCYHGPQGSTRAALVPQTGVGRLASQYKLQVHFCSCRGLAGAGHCWVGARMHLR